MKYALLLFVGLILVSCGTKVPFTTAIQDEFDLKDEKSLAKVQFYTSASIFLERSKSSGNQGTTEDGTLVQNSNKELDRVIIPIGTKCVFESLEDGNLIVRFEPGVGNTITFGLREGQASGKFYLFADWTAKEGGKIEYGNYEYFATTASGSAYLQVMKKKLTKMKRKDRVVRGMKV
jgi:hypothetical protein